MITCILSKLTFYEEDNYERKELFKHILKILSHLNIHNINPNIPLQSQLSSVVKNEFSEHITQLTAYHIPKLNPKPSIFTTRSKNA